MRERERKKMRAREREKRKIVREREREREIERKKSRKVFTYYFQQKNLVEKNSLGEKYVFSSSSSQFAIYLCHI